MKKRGKTVHVDGAYQIVELVQVCQDGSLDVLGYNILGTGDESWLYSLEQAHAKVVELKASNRPSPGF